MERKRCEGRCEGVTRRTVLAAGAAVPLFGGAGLAGLGASPAAAQTRVTIDEANLRPRPIAIPPMLGPDRRLSEDVAQVVAANLERSGLFRPVDQAAFIEQIGDINRAPRFADWRAVGAEALVVGDVLLASGGQIEARFRLWDTVLGKSLAGQELATGAQNWRRIAHMIADQVYEKLTLERGYFDTRVVFIDETGPKQNRLKRLAIMDQDGFNVRLLTRGNELVLTPRFSPTDQRITYMSYATSGQPRVVLMDLRSGDRQVVGDFPNMTFAPRFSPDGARIIMSLQDGGASRIVELDLQSRRLFTLEDSNAINTGPCFAPDGRNLVFESDRTGTQQLYVMPAGGGPALRISYGDGRYSTPVWSPRGDYIAFTKQMSGQFLIGVMRPDGSGERVLTEGFHNEGPTWAPNGRVLMFFRESPGASGGPRIYSIDLTGYNERSVPTPAFASDPAWSPLLS
ncbi:MAG: Tol-Pal system beta propeller repeat protein TolB [Hyphomicrobiaceae bacterium]